ncbi:class I SAM-dependent methyltransferase [Pseudonocardia sp. KRD-291]|nr:class I SAM-dependent methyltransferase [Pseudonocardia sp. KRD291]
MLDVLELRGHTAPTVLDLACGPGSITDRVLTRFPGASVVAVDFDPVLLCLAARVFGDRATVLDVDLARPGWSRTLAGHTFDAVLSSTALHWLAPAQLLGAYTELAQLLEPEAVLLNADHLRYDDRDPMLRSLSAEHDRRWQRTHFAAGAQSWDQWWADAEQLPDLAERMADRRDRFADRPPQPDAPLHFHLSALRTAGFAEAATVWQYLDDYVVLARR